MVFESNGYGASKSRIWCSEVTDMMCAHEPAPVTGTTTSTATTTSTTTATATVTSTATTASATP